MGEGASYVGSGSTGRQIGSSSLLCSITQLWQRVPSSQRSPVGGDF
jgi:hypothetical protein